MTADRGSHDDQLHELAAAYALDALPADEVETFEDHLATCPSCTEEVASLRLVTDRFADLSAAAPPDDLRASVLDAVAGLEQVDPGPVAPAGEQAAPLPPDRPARPSRAARDEPGDVVSLSEARRLRRRSRLAIGVAATLALVAGALGLWANDLAGRLQHQEVVADQVAAVLTAPDAELVTVGGSSLVRSPSAGDAVFAAGSLPAPGAGQVLQLWVIDDQGPTSAGLVEDPTTPTLLDIPVPDGVVVGVTVEPAGGSEQPTSNPLVTFQT